MMWNILPVVLLQLAQPTILHRPLPAKELKNDSINYIVIHSDESPTINTTFRWLRRAGNSYHYYITKTGIIYKVVDIRYEAGHAGLSTYDGLWRMNFYSIGICLENKFPEEYTISQYKSLAWLITDIWKRRPDSRYKPVLTHADIAFPSGRKHDPGEHFNGNLLLNYIQQWMLQKKIY